MQLKKTFLLSFILGLVFYSGCIPVDDISKVWDKGTLDSELEGHWKQMGVEYRSQDQYISFVNKEDVYEIEMTGTEYTHLFDDLPTPPKPKAKCLTLNGWGVLVIDTSDITKRFSGLDAAMGEDIKETDIKSQCGGLDLYKIKDNVLCLYRLKSDVLKKAITNNIIPGTIDPNDMAGPHITKLDMNIIKYITELADHDDNVEQVMKYERVQNLQKALEKSKEYPATDETQRNTLIDVDFPELKYFAEGNIDILLNQLQASSKWKVRDMHGETVCSGRFYKNEKWQDGNNSTFNDGIYDGERFYQISNSFVFKKEPYGPHASWAKEDYVMKVGPEVGKINLKLKLNDQGIISCIAIGQENLWFTFYEQRKKERRIHTQKALAWLKKFLKDVKNAEKEILQNGFAKNLLPKNSIKEGKPSIEIKESSEGGRFTINTWINPRKSGYVYLKVFDNIKNIQHSAHSTKFGSNEFIGFSNNPNELFPYNCTILDYDNEWNHFDEVRFEIWFHSKVEGTEMKLIEKIIKLHKKQR